MVSELQCKKLYIWHGYSNTRSYHTCCTLGSHSAGRWLKVPNKAVIVWSQSLGVPKGLIYVSYTFLLLIAVDREVSGVSYCCSP